MPRPGGPGGGFHGRGPGGPGGGPGGFHGRGPRDPGGFHGGAPGGPGRFHYGRPIRPPHRPYRSGCASGCLPVVLCFFVVTGLVISFIF